MVVSIFGCSPFWGLSFIIMTQEERWRKNYEEIVLFMDTYHRNPAFKRLMAKGEKLKRVNQWTVAVEEILKSDVLRNYQQEMINRLVEAWRTHRSVMVQMPTGTGKTVLMAEVIRNYLRIEQARAEELKNRKNSRGILIVAHRRELLDQIRGTVDYFGIDMKKNRITVESIQKLSREKHRPQGLQPSLVIIDEAHHALAKTYRMLWDWWPKAKFLGLTATPCRLDNTGFTDLFQTLVQSYTIQEFIRMGWLSDFDYVTAEPEREEGHRVCHRPQPCHAYHGVLPETAGELLLDRGQDTDQGTGPAGAGIQGRTDRRGGERGYPQRGGRLPRGGVHTAGSSDTVVVEVPAAGGTRDAHR